jgi:GTPase SAR1 family protein
MTEASNNTQYEEFRKKRQVLLSLIQRQLQALEDLNMPTWIAKVQRLEQRVRDDNFKVFVMGEFKRGKSTFINAMLGQEILPAYATPTTAIINEIKWGEKPRAFLHYITPQDGSQKTTEEILVEQLEEYVVIKVNETTSFSDNGLPIYDSPYEKAVLFWPLELCRDGVEIIDSPGLNEDEKRQGITMDYLTVVDAVIFVISCTAPISKSERSAIATVREAGYEDIFFVCNRINDVSPKERERLKNYCLAQLSPLTRQLDRYVFFLDALGALEGRIKGDQQKVAASGLLSIEAELKNFLAVERGRVKLVRPTPEFKSSLREARQVIAERMGMFDTDLETLQARYEAARTQLDQLEQERQVIVNRVRSFRFDTHTLIYDLANSFYLELAARIPEWVKLYEIKQPMKLYEIFKTRTAIHRVIEETTTMLTEAIARESKEWQTQKLQPLLESRFEVLAKEIDAETSKFVAEAEEVRKQLFSEAAMNIPSEALEEKVGFLERIFAAATGFLAFGVGAAAIGATFGFKEMLKSCIPQFAVAMVVGIISGWNPLVLIPALLATGGIQGLFKMQATNKQIRDKVGETFELKMRESRAENARRLAKMLDDKLRAFEHELDHELGLKIQSIRDQMDAILAEKRQGKLKVDEAKRKLQNSNKELDAIDTEIDELVNQIALSKGRL